MSTTTSQHRQQQHPAARLLSTSAIRAAGRTAALLREERPDAAVRDLQSLTRDELIERALAALALVDIERPLSELTAWTGRDVEHERVPAVVLEHAPWSTERLRRAHSAWARGVRTTEVRLGEREYQARRHAHRRAQQRAAHGQPVAS